MCVFTGKQIEGIKKKDLEGEKVLLRTDLNLPVEDGEPKKTVRFERYMETVEKLVEKDAKTTVLAHQGRPGRKDFLSLEKHSEMMEEYLGQEVELVRCFFGKRMKKSVNSLDNGEVQLIENIRFLSEELQNISSKRHAEDYFVKRMSKQFDLFINDGFSVAHRSHGSITGFTAHLESYPGPVMKNEIESLDRVKDEVENPVLVLGGEKPSDIVRIMEEMIEDVEKVLLGGIPGELALISRGYDLGEKEEWIREKGFDRSEKDLKQIIEQHGSKIIMPQDLKMDEDSVEVEEVNEMTWDIGEKTVEKYSEILESSDNILMKGPVGAFDQGHSEATEKIVDKIAESKGFTVLGGGHTSSLVQRFGHDLDDFSHVSIAGGAFVRYMAGEELPAIKALKTDN